MSEIATAEAQPARHDGPAPLLVTARALGAHLGCTGEYIAKLAAQGVIARSGKGYDQDESRLRYIEHLRSARSARSKADVEFQQAKTELLRIKIAEKHKVLMEFAEHEKFVETLTGLFLTGLSGFAARIGGRDLTMRRVVDAAVYDLRVQISETASKLADERGESAEPSATEQGRT